MNYFITFLRCAIFSIVAFNLSIFKINAQLALPSSPIKAIITIDEDTFLLRDLSDVVGHITTLTDSNNHDHGKDYPQWRYYLSRPHPNVRTIHKYFKDAADEFGVPVELLKAIGQVESNWTQIGPGIDRGWGIMHLVQNDYSNTLTEASQLLDIDIQTLKDDPKQNIRGGAALIAKYFGKKKKNKTSINDWFDAAKKFTGLINDEIRQMQADEYFKILKHGVKRLTLWDEYVILHPYPQIIINDNKKKSSKGGKLSKSQGGGGGNILLTADYGPALAAFTSCNYTNGRNTSIDTWVNHWIGVGTYAGAISWFQNCAANASAHFVIRSVDGEITQVVLIANTAWHCGASGFPLNNSRSIGIEHEATASNPGLWNSPPMLQASATMACYFTNLYGIPTTQSLPGIRGHNDMPGTATACPGTIPWATWMSLLNSCGGGGTPPTAAFTASPTTVCAGSTVSFTDQSTDSPTSWSWSFPGGTPGSSTAQNPTVTYNTAGTFNVTLTATNSSGSDALTRTNFITVIANSVGGTVASSTSVCSGSNSGTLTLSGYTGTILRWQYSTDGGVTWTNIANTSTTQTYSNLTTTTMYRAVVKSGICPSANSAAATITVDPVTVGGMVSGSATVCSGANSGNLTLSGHTGNILRWEYSTDGGVTWTNIANTTTTQTYSNLTTTTIYRAVVKSGVCPSANSSPATITVDPVTVGGIVLSDATVCSGSNSGTLTLSGQVGSVLRWQYSTDSGATWTNIFNTTTTQTYNNLVTTIPNQQTTILYRAVVKSGVCPPENSSPATITIDPVTIGGTVAFDATVCKNSNSGTLTLTGQVGIVLSWEYSIDGGVTWTNIANTTTTQSYSNLTTTTMYHAVVQSGVCPIENSFAATIITLDTMTVAGTVFGSTTACSGANIGTLTLTDQVGNVLNWEYSTDGGITWMSIPNTTALQSYNNLTTTTMYRAVVQSGICPTENSAAATITVDPVTVSGTISGGATVCSGSNSGTLTINGQTGNVLRWEYSSDGGVTWVNIANTTTIQTYSNLTATTMYRAVVKSGVCLPGNSATATVAVDPVSVGGTIPDNTVCSGANNGTLTLTGYVGNILQWEYSTDGGMTWTNIANITPEQDYTNISTVTRYRAIVQSGVCPADTSSIAVIFLFPLTVADAGVDTSISLGYSVILDGSGGEIYSWSPETDLNDPNIANPTTTPLETITYTLTVIDENGCESTDEVTITVLVDYNFIISNLITPNGDGFNDTWYIDNIENYPDCEVSIYNRYGNLIFNSSPYVKEWEGNYKGSQLPDGTYYYVLKCPEDNVFKGGITILRGD